MVVTTNADITICARRVMWGKILNAGQTCVAPDYVIFTDASLQSPFVEACKQALAEFYPEGTDPESMKKPGVYGKVISKRHTEMLRDLLVEAKDRVVIGGEVDVKARFVAPTVVVDCKLDDDLMKREIFGPVLPCITVEGIHAALDTSKAVCPTPLAFYAFGSRSETDFCMCDNV